MVASGGWAGQTGFFRLRFLQACLAGCGPALFDDLMGACDCQGVGGNVFGDAGAGADVGSILNRDGRHQGGIAADENPFADDRTILVDAIVVAGDGAGADVGLLADFAIAEVGEVVGFGALAELGFLDRKSVV